jgi:MFS family permease
MGFLLLILRIGVYESGMFKSIKDSNVSKGNFLKLFSNKKLFFKYLYCISIGVPIWFIVGVLITFSPEFAKEFKFTEPVFAGKAIMFCYIGLAFGDFASGSLSQIFKTRKKVIESFIILAAFFIVVYLFANKFGVVYFYAICLLLGIAGGYWAVFVTNASEQFGINIRATVTTTVPNFVRGAVVPATLLFQTLIPLTGIIYSALTVGFLTILIAFISVRKLEETFGKDLNFLEVS